MFPTGEVLLKYDRILSRSVLDVNSPCRTATNDNRELLRRGEPSAWPRRQLWNIVPSARRHS